MLTSGIMYECVKHDIPFVLAGSIRDDGPLPEVITDALEAQTADAASMIPGVGFCLMVATTLHSIAMGNLLPAWVQGGVRGHQPGDGDEADGPRQHRRRSAS